jgi:hypothetical protein
MVIGDWFPQLRDALTRGLLIRDKKLLQPDDEVLMALKDETQSFTF